MNRLEIAAARAALDKLEDAKDTAALVLERWHVLGDIDASSGELEQAVDLLDRVCVDIDQAIGGA